MQNFVLSPIDPKILIDSIAEKVTANILNAVKNEQQPTQPQEELLTIQQASELLNLSVPTLYSKVSKGELPVMKRSKRLYFSRTELIEYLKAGKRKTSEEIEAEADAYLSNKKSAEL
jgi:excisionase family DNA binding protein